MGENGEHISNHVARSTRVSCGRWFTETVLFVDFTLSSAKHVPGRALNRTRIRADVVVSGVCIIVVTK